jgi:tRNA pseudouridine38-40 synthase
MLVFRIDVEYDGTDFYGWQVQSGLRTVQGEMIQSISKIIRSPFRLIGASRTDAGVHAEGQVASLHLETRTSRKVETLKKALNGLLPRDIYVKSVRRVSPDFHARFSARSKIYRYRVLEGRSPIRSRYVWEYPRPLDGEILEELSLAIKGTHDFSSLSVKTPAGKGKVNVKRAKWVKKGDEWHFIIEADRFLYKMVRILVGLQVSIASGRTPKEVLLEALEEGKKPRIMMAPPQGLSLVEVKYPGRLLREV